MKGELITFNLHTVLYIQRGLIMTNKLSRYQLQLVDNLNTLLAEDAALLNETIIEYVQLLGNTNRMHDLHEYTCKEIENDWGRG